MINKYDLFRGTQVSTNVTEQCGKFFSKCCRDGENANYVFTFLFVHFVFPTFYLEV